jgi:hypothetical protein
MNFEEKSFSVLLHGEIIIKIINYMSRSATEELPVPLNALRLTSSDGETF